MSSMQMSLADSLGAVQARVRDVPTDIEARGELVYLLALTGQWQRARTQLEAMRSFDEHVATWSRAYESCIDCEMKREAVFLGEQAPVVLGEPPDWCAWLTRALSLEAGGAHSEARKLRDAALDECDAVSGLLRVRSKMSKPDTASGADSIPFESLEDGDARMGPMLELVLEGRYVWAPLSRVRRMEAVEERSRWDRLWVPFRFTWENGGEMHAFVPTRYVGSDHSADDDIRLAQCTEWREAGGEGRYLGLGHRTLVAGRDGARSTDVPLLKISVVEIDQQPS
jgi:type VI secretion system protein ImpE